MPPFTVINSLRSTDARIVTGAQAQAAVAVEPAPEYVFGTVLIITAK